MERRAVLIFSDSAYTDCNPFDALAVGYLTSPSLFQCANVKAKIETAPDDAVLEGPPRNKPYLHVSADPKSLRTASYCSSVDARFKEDLLARLLSNPHRADSSR